MTDLEGKYTHQMLCLICGSGENMANHFGKKVCSASFSSQNMAMLMQIKLHKPGY